jgi:hypothetical protein
MPIKSITKQKFDSYPSKKIGVMMPEEYLWYANDDKKIIGAVAQDKTDKDWAYVIMIPDEDGEYAYEFGEVSIESLELAEKKLLEKMRSM